MIDKNDPRLTAYLLGELDESGHEEIRAALAESAELRSHVDGIRETIETIQSALGAEGSGDDELTPQQLAELEAAALQPQAASVSLSTVSPDVTSLSQESPGRTWMKRLAIAALVLYAVGMSVVAWRESKIPDVAVLVPVSDETLQADPEAADAPMPGERRLLTDESDARPDVSAKMLADSALSEQSGDIKTRFAPASDDVRPGGVMEPEAESGGEGKSLESDRELSVMPLGGQEAMTDALPDREAVVAGALLEETESEEAAAIGGRAMRGRQFDGEAAVVERDVEMPQLEVSDDGREFQYSGRATVPADRNVDGLGFRMAEETEQGSREVRLATPVEAVADSIVVESPLREGEPAPRGAASETATGGMSGESLAGELQSGGGMGGGAGGGSGRFDRLTPERSRRPVEFAESAGGPAAPNADDQMLSALEPQSRPMAAPAVVPSFESGLERSGDASPDDMVELPPQPADAYGAFELGNENASRPVRMLQEQEPSVREERESAQQLNGRAGSFGANRPGLNYGRPAQPSMNRPLPGRPQSSRPSAGNRLSLGRPSTGNRPGLAQTRPADAPAAPGAPGDQPHPFEQDMAETLAEESLADGAQPEARVQMMKRRSVRLSGEAEEDEAKADAVAGTARRQGQKKSAAPKTWKPASASANRARLSVGRHDDLLLTARDTYVRIDGFRARVMFDLYYYNDRGRQLEGQFMLRLPDDASLHYFAFGPTELPASAPTERRRRTGKPGEDLEPEEESPAAIALASLRAQTEAVGSDLARRASDSRFKAQPGTTFGQVKHALVAPRQKAALAYEETVRRRVDPALVEWAGPGIFQTKVFPLMPKKLHRIVVGYDVTLRQDGDQQTFTLDLPEDEAGGRVEFDVFAAPGTEATLQPETEPFVSGSRAYYRYDSAAPRDYSVRLSGLGTPLIEHAEKDGSRYFATRVVADLPDQPAAIDSKQAVFLLDTSWSDRPEAFSRRLKLFKQLLSSNRDSIDEFAVLQFNVQARWWRSEFLANDPENVAAFLEDADDLALEGATDLGTAIAEAVAPSWSEEGDAAGTRPNYFLLSDAAPTWGVTDPGLIGKPLARSGSSNAEQEAGERSGGALFAYRLAGTPNDRGMMDRLAQVSGGAVFGVAENAELKSVARAHRARPWRLEQASASGAEEVLVRGSGSAIYPGQPLMVVGRGDLEGPIELVFRRGDESQAVTVEPTRKIGSPAAARLYGGMAVEHLEPYESSTKDVLVAYARYFNVPGRTCSMVMLESEADYERFGVNLTPEQDLLVIESTSVESVIEAERAEAIKRNVNARARFQAWIASMESASLLQVPAAMRLAIKQMPESAFAFAPDPLDCKTYRRSQFDVSYLDELALERPQFDSMMAEADELLIRFGADDALKAASTLVEAKPSDVELLRSVAFRAIQWKRSDQAASLLWRVTKARPYQPQCLMLLGRALAETGRLDEAAVCFDLVAHGKWNGRWASSPEIAKVELLSVLEKIDAGESSIAGYAKARRRQLRGQIAEKGIDVAVIMHWNTDRTDVDLHVTEPNGEVCYYQNRNTKSGGRMTADITEGLGPEMYTHAAADSGEFHVQAKYYRSDQNRTSAPTEVLVTTVRDLGRPEIRRQVKRVTLSGQKEMETIQRLRVNQRKK